MGNRRFNRQHAAPSKLFAKSKKHEWYERTYSPVSEDRARSGVFCTADFFCSAALRRAGLFFRRVNTGYLSTLGALGRPVIRNPRFVGDGPRSKPRSAIQMIKNTKVSEYELDNETILH